MRINWKRVAIILLLTSVFSFLVYFSYGQEISSFSKCVQEVETAPVASFINRIDWIESSQSSGLLNKLLSLKLESVGWDDISGPQYPALQRSIPMRSIGLILNDGTLVQLIFDGQYKDKYYGWMTYSTYQTPASYNSYPNPHVHCGFWSISIDTMHEIEIAFYDEIIRDQLFEQWMR